MDMKKRKKLGNGRTMHMLACCIFCLLAVPVQAQRASADEPTVLFRFVSDRDMFYREGNEAALDSLFRLLDPASLATGSVKVDGYSRTKALSRTRCNRVKSELITRRGLREAHFTTQSLTGTFRGRQNIVVVTVPITLPEENMPVTEKKRPVCDTEVAESAPINDPVTETVTPTAETPMAENAERQSETPASASCSTQHKHTLSVRANLLRWATLTPDLGLEWRINKDWSLLVNGSWTSWSWDGKNRRYALWEVAPEVRYYIGKEKRGYVGAMYKVGSFNYKFSETGKQGDLMGGGITGGYMLRLNRALNLDFSLGVGYLHADYEKYTVIDGVRVRRGKETKNWWGPTSAGVTLVWTIF